MTAGHLVGLLVTLSLALATPAFAQSGDPLSVSASYSDAGPYGVLWIAYLAPDGDLSVRVSHRQASGHTVSRYLSSKDRVSVLRRTIDEARFFVAWDALFSKLPFKPER